MPNIPMVDLKGQYAKIKEEVDEVLGEILESTRFIGGEHVTKLAEELADYNHVKHVIPCANGTDALQIALMALDLQPGDEVITTPFTFVATAEVIALLKLKPVFVDIDPRTFNIHPGEIESAITDRTKCIIPVHLFGLACQMEAIMQIADKHNLYVVEDNAQGIGSTVTYEDGDIKFTGSIGHIGTTSFFPSKNLGCYGDGGAIFTSDDALAEKIRLITNHGMSNRYHYEAIGVNSRLDAMQAGILRIKLKRLPLYNESRQTAAYIYNHLLGGREEIILPMKEPNTCHVYHQYTIRIKQKRDNVRKYLTERGVASGVYYPIPLHMHEAYSHFGFSEGDLPTAEAASNEVLSLPMHTELTYDIQQEICNTLLEALDQ